MNNQLIHATNYELAIKQRDEARAELEKVTVERDGALFAAASHLRTVEQQRKIIEGMPRQGDDEMPISRSTYGTKEACEAEHARRAALSARPAAAPQQAVSVPEDVCRENLESAYKDLGLAKLVVTQLQERLQQADARILELESSPAATPAPTVAGDGGLEYWRGKAIKLAEKLTEATAPKPEANAAIQPAGDDAARYRLLRRKVCIAGGKFHILNLDPIYLASHAEIELDAAIDAQLIETKGKT